MSCNRHNNRNDVDQKFSRDEQDLFDFIDAHSRPLACAVDNTPGGG
jgi:hypothetical protein